jgi:RNA polymerase sigma-70 factor, ECF subfamily
LKQIVSALAYSASFANTFLQFLLENHRNQLVEFLYRLLGDHAAAEELAQEAFLRALQSPANCSTPARFIIALFRSAIRLAAQRTSSNSNGTPQGWSRDVAVRRALGALPAPARCAVLLHKYGGFDCPQIAQILDCSDSTAKSLLARGYDTLRAQLAEPVVC